jgi:hypothetical protein
MPDDELMSRHIYRVDGTTGLAHAAADHNDIRMTTVDKASPVTAIAEAHACQLEAMIDHARDWGVPIRCDAALPDGKVVGDLTYQAQDDALTGRLGYWTRDQTGQYFHPIASVMIHRDTNVEYSVVNQPLDDTAPAHITTTCRANVLTGQLQHGGPTVQFSLREGIASTGGHSPNPAGGAGAN